MKHCTKLLTPAECLFYALSPVRVVSRVSPSARLEARRYRTYRPRRPTPQVDINELLRAEREKQRLQSQGGRSSGPSYEVPVDDRRLEGYTYDEAIDKRWVQVKQEETNTLNPPQLLAALIGNIDRSTQIVLQLGVVSNDTAVVTVADRADLIARGRDKEKQLKELQKQQKTAKPKQIELNWAISENDLNLKLRQMEGFLDKGRKVEILMANRRRQRRASPQEAQSTMDKVKNTLAESGAREIREMQGQVGKQALMIVQKSQT